jgi:hypothetical protein
VPALLLGLWALGLGVAQAQSSPQLYRWQDEQGNVHYSDTIPPSQMDAGHTQLSEEGLRIRTVPPAPTLEEIQRERELERLRAQQHRLIEQQKADDRVLLRTFRSVDDIVMARDGKISAIDVMIQVTKANIRRQRDWLTQLRADAAELERAGKPVTDQLKERIASTERSLQQSLAAILERERQKQDIRESFARDLKRFRQLKDLPEEAPKVEEVQQLSKLDNLVECGSRQECDRIWTEALGYVREHATLPIETSGADVAMTEPPASLQDVALTVTRIWNKDRSGAVIFLDLQCRSYSANAENCRTEPRLAILSGFRPAMERHKAQAAVPGG